MSNSDKVEIKAEDVTGRKAIIKIGALDEAAEQEYGFQQMLGGPEEIINSHPGSSKDPWQDEILSDLVILGPKDFLIILTKLKEQDEKLWLSVGRIIIDFLEETISFGITFLTMEAIEETIEMSVRDKVRENDISIKLRQGQAVKLVFDRTEYLDEEETQFHTPWWIFIHFLD